VIASWPDRFEQAAKTEAPTDGHMEKAEPFKEFELKKLGSDESLKLADLRGKVVSVDFWFPSRHWCRVEFPHLQKLVEKYGSKDFMLVTINNDPTEESTGRLMMDKQKYAFVNLQAPDSKWVSKTYGVRGFPATYVLDADGKAMFTHVGYRPHNIEQMNAEIAAPLARAAKSKNN
jgi:thiol-disulfide isomerase/thioredoxin